MRAILVLVLVYFSACQNSSNKNDFAKRKVVDSSENKNQFLIDSALEDKISDTLVKLSFIKKSNSYIDSFSQHKHGIAFLMDSSRNNLSEIFIQAGYNGDLRFETYYQIYVDSKNMDIKIYEPVGDRKLSIKQYEYYLDTLK